MTGDRVRLLTAWSGLVAAFVLVAGVLLAPGRVPGFDALPEQVVRWTLDDRRRLLVSTVPIVVGLSVLVVFYAGLRAMVGRAEGAPALLSTIAYGSFLLVLALALFAIGLLQVQTFVAIDGDPGLVRALHEARFVVGDLAAAPTIVSAVAFGLAMVRTGFPARWLGWASGVVALAHAPELIALSRTGGLSPTGVLAQLGPLVFVAWVVAVSVRLLVRPRPRTH